MCVHVADFYIKIYLSKSVRWYSKGQSKVAELRQVYHKKVKVNIDRKKTSKNAIELPNKMSR